MKLWGEGPAHLDPSSIRCDLTVYLASLMSSARPALAAPQFAAQKQVSLKTLGAKEEAWLPAKPTLGPPRRDPPPALWASLPHLLRLSLEEEVEFHTGLELSVHFWPVTRRRPLTSHPGPCPASPPQGQMSTAPPPRLAKALYLSSTKAPGSARSRGGAGGGPALGRHILRKMELGCRPGDGSQEIRPSPRSSTNTTPPL
ncbi:hypothetical protein Cadr_000006455 [Camelus dromedarius]|uniref:Uncharacterized protein n=1 Tax=Camelus dromedarius TaxID=9838 RepID=A0A5N4E0G6_CAMDR|nr:hypothetical protein Cadr_000006455 [Camelus dromedarius]